MKQLVTFLFLVCTTLTYAQYPGNANDWIEYDQEYYKFSVTEDGIYRLTKADLEAAGINSSDIIGMNFKMIRNGEEVPLYVTTNSDFGDNDFIEFLGQKNDGTTDTPLYPSVEQQPGISKSLFTNESIYFLTIDNSQSHLRITAIENDLSNLPEKEEFYLAEITQTAESYYAGKYARRSGTNLYESTFDNTEGYNQRMNSNQTKIFNFNASDVFETNEVDAVIEFKVATINTTSSASPSSIEVTLGNSTTETLNTSGKFEYDIFTKTYTTSEIGNSQLKIKNQSPLRIYVGEQKLTYPRKFEFADQTSGYINVNKSGSRYIELDNVSADGTIVVYDLSSNERLTQEITATTPIHTSQNSTQNNLAFDTNITAPQFVSTTTFTDYVSPNNNLVVIYNETLEQPIDGENYVNKFINHKESNLGGNWNITKVNIDQLIDQFAYGITKHNAAIKNYVAELKQNNNIPEHIILIGKGYEYQLNYSDTFTDNYIPTYGNPGSDSQLVADYGSSNLNCGIGRIAARTSNELKHYVDKVIEYQTLMSQTEDSYQTKDKLWMKNAMHLGGGRDAVEQDRLKRILNGHKAIFEDPDFGGNVDSFYKNSTDPIQNADIAEMDSLINNGLALINYFGHSSPNSLEFNINDFNEYNQEGKYPFMLTNGCYVGDLFQDRYTLSEDFILTENAGTISFMGPSQYGIASGMNNFCNNFYDLFVTQEYGITIGEAIMKSQNQTSNDLIARLTKQQMTFHGDPTLSIYSHEKPDYLVTTEDIYFEPNVITTDIEEFTVNAIISNIGKAINEPVDITMTRLLPNGDEQTETITLEHVYYQDTVSFSFTTSPLIAEGINKFMVEIDKTNQLDEITRSNNNLSAYVERAIINDAVKPILPNEFGITNDTEVNLTAYTSRFTAQTQNFEMQIDTTELFNSSLLLSQSISSNGGSLTWQPNLNYENEQVYYWRVRKQEGDWNNSSFIFLNDYEEGWNQSHYFQFLKDDYENIFLNNNRVFEFADKNATVNVRTAIFPTIPRNQTGYSIDGVVQAKRRCYRNNERLGIAIIDEKTGIPLQNESMGGGIGLYNSIYCSATPLLFYYAVDTPEARQDIISAINDIEEGKYVLIFSLDSLNPEEFNWENNADLRNVLIDNGAQEANNINENAPYAFFFQKGNPNFAGTKDYAGNNENDIIDENFVMTVKANSGHLTTPLIGPAANWNTFIWNWDNSIDNATEGDNIVYSIIGVTKEGEENIITSNQNNLTYNLSQIDANIYPYLKIKIDFADAQNYTPAQLKQLRVIYEALPEMAIDITDIVTQGEWQYNQNEVVTINYSLENIYTKDMSPILVSYQYSPATGAQITEDVRYEELLAGLTQGVSINLNTTTNMVGDNLLYIDANPNDDQPEQYHFNNIALIEYTVTADNENPYLDVTFDGVHIIDGDLIADTPEILISLTDENEFLLLNDADDFEIIVTYPNGEQVTFDASSQEITFYPATDLSDNSAKIEFTPEFAPGVYEMRVQATDRSNNQAGENDYIISFEVTNEDIVTQIINYPNPFTTSTEFIARIIGDAPEEVLIQIFSSNGKVIRELHSYAGEIELSQGNNYYTVAKWDGTDTFGDPVGNGVYFYKISMKRNGELIEAYDTENYSEYFHNGLGKLYIMR